MESPETTGEAPETTTPDAGTVADESTPESPAPEAPEAQEAVGSEETPDDGGFDLSLYEEGTPEYEMAERAQKHFRGQYIRKTQELAQQRAEVASTLELQAALDSDDPEAKQAAVQELLTRAGYNVEFDGQDDPDEGIPDDELLDDEPDEDDLHPEVKALLERERERDAAAEQAERDRQVQGIRQEVAGELNTYAEARGFKDEGLPDELRLAVLSTAIRLPEVDGKPDIKGAIAEVEALEAATIQRYLQSKKTGARPAARGRAGVARINVNDEAERQKASLAVAGRHFASQ